MSYLDALKKKLADHESGGGERSSTRTKLEEGNNIFRIIVDPESGDPFREFSFHYNVGKASGFLCPKRNFDEFCPVCEFASKSWKKAADENDDNQKNIIKKLFAKERYFSLAVNRADEAGGAKWLGYSSSVYRDLLTNAIKIFEEDEIEVTDPIKGFDVELDYRKPGGKKFFETKVNYARKPSKLAPSKEKINEILESAPSFFEAYDRKTPSQVQELLNAYLLSSDEDAEDASRETVYGGDEDDKFKSALDELNNA